MRLMSFFGVIWVSSCYSGRFVCLVLMFYSVLMMVLMVMCIMFFLGFS